MIEVEKKFILKEDDEKRLTAGAEPVGERTFTDTYFDGLDYSLTIHDKWLRSRDGKFQLKMPLDSKGMRQAAMGQYEELEDEAKIKEALGLMRDAGPLPDVLKKNGYLPCAEFTTTRRKYRKEGFVLDFDVVDFGYKIAEIELMVEDRADMEKASQKITEFARQYGLDLAPVRAKIHEYLKRYNPAHFEALVRTGIAPKPAENPTSPE
jgi:adenylate cyclase class IV